MAKKAVSTQSTVTQQELPAWAQQYYGSILSRGLSTIDQPYQAYTGDRVAGFTPEQLQSFDMVQKGLGNYMPYIDEASIMNMEAGAESASDAASPFFSQASEGSGAREANPYLTAGTSREAINAAVPYIQRAGIGSALASANPYLAAGTGSFTNNVNQYMNPYNQAVTDRIGAMAARNLTENLLPSINRTFIGGGTFGGRRSAEFTARAIRDSQEAALAEQNKALQAGYGQASDIYNTEAERNLNAASTSGQLSDADLSRMLSAGKSAADIFNQIAANNLSAGQTAGSLKGQDLSRLADIGASVGQITGADASRKLEAARNIAGLGSQVQNQYGNDVSALSQVGGAKQALGQQVADTKYADYLREQGAPIDRLKDLAGLTAGMPMPLTTYENQTGSAPAPSTLGTLAGLVTSGIGAIGSSGGFGKDGYVSNMFKSGSSAAPAQQVNEQEIYAAQGSKNGGPITKRKSKRGLGWLKDIR
jgi:hypothetical protein